MSDTTAGTNSPYPWFDADAYPEACMEAVTRGGREDVCGKPAGAVADHPEDGKYPVCIHHGRGRPVVPLVEIRRHWVDQGRGSAIRNPAPAPPEPINVYVDGGHVTRVTRGGKQVGCIVFVSNPPDAGVS